MSRKPKRFHVERNEGVTLGWRTIFGACGTRQFCEGWVTGMESCYPSKPHRIVATCPDGSIEIVLETRGHGEVYLNCDGGHQK